MKTSTKVILGVGGVAVLGFVTYLALKPKTPIAPKPPRYTPTPTPSPNTGGGSQIDTYVKAVTDIIGIFSKPKTTTSPASNPPIFTQVDTSSDSGNYM